MAFDPDAYLTEKGQTVAFDPDAYLAEKTSDDAVTSFDADAYLNEKEIELQKDSERARERKWIEHAEINDVLHNMMAYLP